MNYQQLLSATSSSGSSLHEPPPLTGVDEMEIQSLWFSGLLPRNYQTRSGEKVQILSPGEWNRGPGPDFLHAALEIDGKACTGAVEIDLTARHWDLHGHSSNESFETVALHVVLQDEGPAFFTRTAANREVPRVLIPPEDVLAALGRPRLSQTLAQPGRCLSPLSKLPEEAVFTLLEEAARHRADQKARRFRRIADQHGFSQALWEAFADCLGFSANRLPFRLLAQRLPVKALQSLDSETRTAILFGTAGFLTPDLHREAPPDSRCWLENLWQIWWKERSHYEFPASRRPQWQTAGSRPGNHPQRRLAALAAAASSSSWQTLVELARQPPPFQQFRESFKLLTDPFWDHHHTLKSARTETPRRLLGASRIDEFLINTLYPLALSQQSRPSPDQDPSKSWESYLKLRSTSSNQKVKRCCERLFGSKTNARIFLKRAWSQQGLLQIYQDFCLEDRGDCLQCTFPEQLSRIRE